MIEVLGSARVMSKESRLKRIMFDIMRAFAIASPCHCAPLPLRASALARLCPCVTEARALAHLARAPIWRLLPNRGAGRMLVPLWRSLVNTALTFERRLWERASIGLARFHAIKRFVMGTGHGTAKRS